jgi:antibiotic biosynthesis monooxygenase (ABM) superfamily enzyme
MSKARILHIIATDCKPEHEVRFNKWYNEVHVPMLMKFKGVKKVTRYKLIEEKASRPQFLAVYEFDNMKDFAEFPKSKAFQDAIAEMEGTWGADKPNIGLALVADPIKTFG